MQHNNNPLPKHLEQLEHSIWGFFLRNYRITIITILAILLLGIQGALSIPQEVNPEIKIPTATIMTPYLGANPVDVEKLVTDKIEAQIGNVDNIDTITSTSQEGMSSIIVNFEASSDMSKNMENLRSELDKIQDLPADVEKPTAQELSLSDTPIITFSFSGNYTEEQLKEYGELVEETVEKVSGISEVITNGIRDKEFQIKLNPESIEQYGLTIGEVVQLLQSEHLNAPVGNITLENTKYPIRLAGSINTVETILSLPVRSTESGFLYMRDIATVSETFSRRTVLSRVSSKGQESRPSVSLALFKKTGGNTIKIIDTAKAEVEELYTSGILPDGLVFETTNDNSEFIREDLSTLINNGIQTVILIGILMMLVLGIKEALIASISIPLVFCVAFVGLNMLGLTLNSMTLFSLILALGLLVDTAIIMLEGFHEYYFIEKKSSYEAALQAIYTYRWPLVSGTMTTIAAFVPMFLVGGIMGEFLRSIPITIIITLSASLFVAIAICTSISYLLFQKRKPEKLKKKKKIGSKFFAGLRKNYLAVLTYIITHRWSRWTAVILVVLAFVASLALPITGILKVQMFPQVNVNYFTISLEAPQGTALERTDEIVRKVETILREEPLIKNYVVTIGSGAAGRDSVLSGGGSGSSSHLAGFSVNLIDKEDREETSSEIIDTFRDRFAGITEARVSIVEEQAGPPTGAPIEIRITGPDLDEIARIATFLEKELQNIPGTVEIENDIQTGTGEFVLSLDREAMRSLGIRPSDISSTLRAAAFGVTANTVQQDGEDQDVVVFYDWGQGSTDITSLETLSSLELSTARGGKVPLSAVADITLGVSYTAISHYDRDRIVRVTAQTDGTPVVDITAQLQEKLAAFDVPSGYEVEFGGENEATEESFQDLFSSMIVAVFLIGLILVLQFNSFVQPFIILFSVPLSLIGVFSGLSLFGLYLSFPAFIGVVSLAGIVVNDAIVLIDRINQNRSNGVPFIDSIAESTIARMQPIFLTSITTIVGLLPLSLSDPVWGGLGFSIIFGLTFATVLTLLIIPVLYTMMEGKGARKRGEQYSS